MEEDTLKSPFTGISLEGEDRKRYDRSVQSIREATLARLRGWHEQLPNRDFPPQLTGQPSTSSGAIAKATSEEVHLGFPEVILGPVQHQSATENHESIPPLAPVAHMAGSVVGNLVGCARNKMPDNGKERATVDTEYLKQSKKGNMDQTRAHGINDAYRDESRQSSAADREYSGRSKKIPKSLSSSTSRPPTDSPRIPSSGKEPSTAPPIDSIDPERFSTPHWVNQPGTLKKGKLDKDNQVKLSQLRETIKRLERGSNSATDREAFLTAVRHHIHELAFTRLDHPAILHSHLLESARPDCLARLFAGTKSYPHDITADTQELAMKWCKEDFDIDPLRGIKIDSKGRQSWDETYHRIGAYEFGHNSLVNGQWWPNRRCLLRDGGHGQIEAGISGRWELGAYSIVVSNSAYEDKDEGDRLFYCGTDKKEDADADTAGTRCLTNSELQRDDNKQRRPVRVFRSANMNASSPYRPARGIRYDGLYNVVGYTQISPSSKRFQLERLPDQPPIRYQGLWQRPTAQEVNWYDDQRALRQRHR